MSKDCSIPRMKLNVLSINHLFVNFFKVTFFNRCLDLSPFNKYTKMASAYPVIGIVLCNCCIPTITAFKVTVSKLNL